MKFETNGLEIYLIPLAFVLFFYFIKRNERESTAREELNEVMEAGLTKPSSLHPLINPNKCLGSGSCVSACPEWAIGIIKGKAVFIHPTVCIGHL